MVAAQREWKKQWKATRVRGDVAAAWGRTLWPRRLRP